MVQINYYVYSTVNLLKTVAIRWEGRYWGEGEVLGGGGWHRCNNDTPAHVTCVLVYIPAQAVTMSCTRGVNRIKGNHLPSKPETPDITTGGTQAISAPCHVWNSAGKIILCDVVTPRWPEDGGDQRMAVTRRWRWPEDGGDQRMAVTRRWRWPEDGGGTESVFTTSHLIWRQSVFCRRHVDTEATHRTDMSP